MAILGLNLAKSGDFRAKFGDKVAFLQHTFALGWRQKWRFFGAQIGSFGKIFLEALKRSDFFFMVRLHDPVNLTKSVPNTVNSQASSGRAWFP